MKKWLWVETGFEEVNGEWRYYKRQKTPSVQQHDAHVIDWFYAFDEFGVIDEEAWRRLGEARRPPPSSKLSSGR